MNEEYRVKGVHVTYSPHGNHDQRAELITQLMRHKGDLCHRKDAVAAGGEWFEALKSSLPALDLVLYVKKDKQGGKEWKGFLLLARAARGASSDEVRVDKSKLYDQSPQQQKKKSGMVGEPIPAAYRGKARHVADILMLCGKGHAQELLYALVSDKRQSDVKAFIVEVSKGREPWDKTAYPKPKGLATYTLAEAKAGNVFPPSRQPGLVAKFRDYGFHEFVPVVDNPKNTAEVVWFENERNFRAAAFFMVASRHQLEQAVDDGFQSDIEEGPLPPMPYEEEEEVPAQRKKKKKVKKVVSHGKRPLQFKRFLHRETRAVFPSRISKLFVQVLNDLWKDWLERVAEQAKSFTKSVQQDTILPRAIVAAAIHLIPAPYQYEIVIGRALRLAGWRGTFNDYDRASIERQNKRRVFSRADQRPVPRVRRLLRLITNMRVSGAAAELLTAFLMVFIRQVLSELHRYRKDMNLEARRKRIDAKQLIRGVAWAQEFGQLLFGVDYHGNRAAAMVHKAGQLASGIHRSLLPAKTQAVMKKAGAMFLRYIYPAESAAL